MRNIIKKEVVTANIVDQVKDDVRVYKNLQLGIIEEREKVAAPITRELGKVGQQITDIDKRQEEMLGQLGENQLELMHSQPQLAIESPEPPPALETPKRPMQPKQPITLNFYKRFDTKFQSDYDLPSTKEFPNMTKDKLEMITQKVTKAKNMLADIKVRLKALRRNINLMEI